MKRGYNMSKKVIVSTPRKMRTLDAEKDFSMICYHIIMNNAGKSLKWQTKLKFWIRCKFSDLKSLIVKGLKI